MLDIKKNKIVVNNTQIIVVERFYLKLFFLSKLRFKYTLKKIIFEIYPVKLPIVKKQRRTNK